MLEFSQGSGKVYLNLGNERLVAINGRRPPRRVEAALDAIFADRNRKRPLDDMEIRWVDDVIASDCCVSGCFLTPATGWALSALYSEAFVQRSRFATSIRNELERCGLFDFAEEQTNQIYTLSVLSRIICIFALSIKGPHDLSSLKSEVISTVFDFFRDDTKLRFRKELWNGNPHFHQCLGELARAFGRFYDDPDLSLKGSQFRRTHQLQNTRRAFFATPSNFVQSLLPEFKVYLLSAKGTLRLNEYMFMGLNEWIAKEFGDLSYIEVMRGAIPVTPLSHYYSLILKKKPNSIIQLLKLTRQFQEFILERMVDPDQYLWRFVTQKEYREVVDQYKNSGDTSAKGDGSRPIAERYVPILEEVLDEGESGWLGTQRSCYEKVVVNGKRERLYCPVLPGLFRVLVIAPFRGAGTKRMDSGEGDLLQYNFPDDRWEPNSSKHAGYWAKRTPGPEGRKTRGYAYHFENADPPFTGIFLNTNKTGQIRPIKWGNREIHATLWNIKQWQLKYNPIKGPISGNEYADNRAALTVSGVNKLPDIFPLFRLPPGSSNRRYLPPSPAKMSHFWARLLLEVQRRWNRRNPDEQVELVQFQSKTGQPMSPLYTIHGLRSAGITQSIDSGGLSAEFVQTELAQHENIGMLSSYVKRGAAGVDALLERSYRERSANRQSTFIAQAQNWTLDDVRKKAAFISEDAVVVAATKASKACFCNVSIGLCPKDGSGCETGGPVLRKDGRNSTYGLVLGGHRNCIMCRYFLSGPCFADELTFYGEDILIRQERNSVEQARIRSEMSDLLKMMDKGQIDRSVGRQRRDRMQVEILDLQYDEALLNSAQVRVENLLGACKAILNTDQENWDGDVALSLISFDLGGVSELFNSSFERAAWMTIFSRVHPILVNERTEAELAEYLNEAAFDVGVRPKYLLNGLTPHERKLARDQATLALLRRYDSSELASMFGPNKKKVDEEKLAAVFTSDLLEVVELENIYPASCLARIDQASR